MERFLAVDDYGREFIGAPEGKVLKGYLICTWGYVEHCLVDQWGLVFTSGHGGPGGGWSSCQHSDHIRLVVFPNPVERGNEIDNSSWRWEDWYERNWLCDSWAWMYMKTAGLRDLELKEAA